MARAKLKLFGARDSITMRRGARWGFVHKLPERYNEEDLNRQIFNLNLIKLAVFFILSFFILRLFYLTVIAGAKNRVLADENRIRLVEVEALRGKVFDRNGTLLAVSSRVYHLKHNSQEEEISEDRVRELEREGLAGENFVGGSGRIDSEARRNYLLGDAAAHVLGYVSLVQKEDLIGKPALASSDHVGRLGVENVYDDFLRGRNGKKILEVDAVGNKISILGESASVDGSNLTLTIDAKLQKKAFEVLKDHAEKSSKKAALVIQNPNNGEILALASYPSFDPTDIGKFVATREKPFFNRVTQGEYPPGSVFKVSTALAGLESGAIDANTQIEDVGEFAIGDIKFPNWYFLSYGGKDGILKVVRAIARSNDIFFYRVAERTGLTVLHDMAVKLGFGQKTGIDLPGEALGLVPEGVWKKSALGQDWYLGDTMHMGIGQGFMLATPIQLSQMVSFAATGKIMKPHLVSKIGENKVTAKIVGENVVGESNLQLVREGMKQACETGGTAWPFFDAKYKVGCKTGTAEKGLGNPHAWFAAFAPFENPSISITVLIEDGGEGSSVAGPVAKEILDWYFLGRK